MRKFLTLTAGIACLGLGTVAQAQNVDLFTFPQAELSDGNNAASTFGASQVQDPANPSSILGEYRDLYVNCLGGCNSTGSTTSFLSVDPDGPDNNPATGGSLSFANGSSVEAWAQVKWDGSATGVDANFVPVINYTGLNGLDLVNQQGCPASGCNAFQFITYFADLGFAFTIELYTDADSFVRYVLPATEVSPALGNSPHVQIIPFALFETTFFCDNPATWPGQGVLYAECGTDAVNGRAADATNIGAMVVSLNVGSDYKFGATGPNPGSLQAAVDLTLGSLTKVPEPSVLALLGSGLLAGGVARLRRRRV